MIIIITIIFVVVVVLLLRRFLRAVIFLFHGISPHRALAAIGFDRSEVFAELAATWVEVSLVLLVVETEIQVMLTTTLRLELARSAASARHVVVCV